MKKNIYFVFILPLMLATSCQDAEMTEALVEKDLSCNCPVELHSPEPGEIQTFGDDVNSLKLTSYNGTTVMEGDIILTEEQIVLMTAAEEGSDAGRVESAGQAVVANRWPNRVVPYVINSSLPNASRVTNAIAHWESRTNYDFVQRTTQTNYIEFIPSNGCSSHIGMIGGRQYIYLGSNCTQGNTIHEIGHALGLWHEHTRADRDYSVNINWNNINSGAVHNFEMYNFNSSGFDNGAFDFGSIMMYPSSAFSSNGNPTITRKDGSTFTAQRTALSSGDIAGAAFIYNATQLATPSGVRAVHDGDETLTVTWNAVAGASEYWIYTLFPGQDVRPKLYRIRSSTSWTRELKSKYRSGYRIWVAARNANGNTSIAREASYNW
ncbi:M12 family metallopeptidase [Fulvivirga sp. 29W222]|uniref:M12 family metallopeptidase n=1 Tax=Fulvivirga marina TaxID=2494733 RepID=A0A937KET8_9BACT|nr:M12 family metallopeptidase [Fulvivirga marina]MBL6447545.1 M12 family metallopeptidase [Fulvivirga marina]